jgi:DNA-directed RNA polymerase specialized sigma24 family protein
MPQDEQWLTALYRESFPLAANTVQQLGGDLETARDLFHDAMIVYLEKLQDNSLPPHQPKAYLAGITKMLWYQQYRTEQRYRSLPDEELLIAIPDDLHPPAEEVPVLQYLRTAGKKCMELLQAFYYQHLSMEQIAAAFHYKSSRSATVQKHKCLEKVRDAVKQTEAYAERIA